MIPPNCLWTPRTWRRFVARGPPESERRSFPSVGTSARPEAEHDVPMRPSVRPARGSFLRFPSSSSFSSCTGFRAGDVVGCATLAVAHGLLATRPAHLHLPALRHAVARAPEHSDGIDGTLPAP